MVVTVDTVGDDDIFNYSLNLAREWGIGDKEKNNGCLIFLSIQDKKSYVQVGYGLEGRLTDGKTGKLQDDYLIPYLKEEEYNEGIKNLFDAIVLEVYSEYNIDSPEDVNPQKRKGSIDIGVIVGLVFIVGVAALAIIADKKGWADDYKNSVSGRDNGSSKGGSRGSGSGGSSGGGGNFGGGGSGRSW